MYMYRYLLIAALALPLGAFASDLSVSGRIAMRDGNKSVSVTFSNRDREAIETYYRRSGEYREERGHKHGKGMPPGLAKRGGKVPPGLAKHGGLPPGLAKRDRLPMEVETEVLPRELERRLSPLPSGDYVRVRVGTDFAIMDKKTRVVLDVARDLGGV
jgi:hypothetical protein